MRRGRDMNWEYQNQPNASRADLTPCDSLLTLKARKETLNFMGVPPSSALIPPVRHFTSVPRFERWRHPRIYITQPLLAFFCVVPLAHRELIQKPNGVNNTHLFKQNKSGSAANFRYWSCFHVHASSSITSSVGDTTEVSNPSKVLAFLKNLSSQVQK